MNKLRVLFDINIILDVLQKREPFYLSSAQALSLAEDGVIVGYISANTVTTLFYLMTKGQSAGFAKNALTNLIQFLCICKVDQSTIEQALNLQMKDFEDAVQATAALHIKVDYLVTRNIKDYSSEIIAAIKPIELIKSIR